MSETFDDLVVGIKFEIDRSAKSKARSELTSFKREAMRAMVPITGALTAASFTKFTMDVVKARTESVMLGKQLKINADELYRNEKAGQRFGTSFTQTLLSLQDQFAGFGMEDIGGVINSLGKFGMDPTKILEQQNDPMGLFKEISKQWQDLSTEQRVRAGDTLGFDQGMKNMLNNPDLFKQYFEESSAPTAQEMEEAKAAKEAFDKLGLTMDKLFAKVATELIPTMTRFTSWLETSGIDTISEALKAMSGVIETYFGSSGDEKDKVSLSTLSDKELHSAINQAIIDKVTESAFSSIGKGNKDNKFEIEERHKALLTEKIRRREQEKLDAFVAENANRKKAEGFFKSAPVVWDGFGMEQKTSRKNQTDNDVSGSSSGSNQKKIIVQQENNYHIKGSDPISIRKEIETYNHELLQDAMEQ